MGEKPFLFEVSWEVANKVGGIYTVIESKSALVKEEYGDNYFLVGPYLPGKSDNQFVEKPLPAPLAKAQNDLAPEGVTFHYGTWLLDSEPQVQCDPSEREIPLRYRPRPRRSAIVLGRSKTASKGMPPMASK